MSPSKKTGLLEKFETKENQETVKRWFKFVADNRKNFWDNIPKEVRVAHSKMMTAAKQNKSLDK